MSWEEKCVQLAKHTVDWFWAEFSADAYFASAPEEVPPLEDHILWFALPTDRNGIGHTVEQLRKANEYLRNASGEIDKVATGDLMADWEGDAADSVKEYISSVKTSCAHLETYIDALLMVADAHGKRLYALEADVVDAISLAKKAVEDGNDTSGQIAAALAGTVVAVATGGAGGAVIGIVSSALNAGVDKAFNRTITGDGVYATRELKDALGGLRDRFATAMESVGDALNGLAKDVSKANIPAEVDLPRVVYDRAFDPSQFLIDDPNYSNKGIATQPLFPLKELVPSSEEERAEKRRNEAAQKRLERREDMQPRSRPRGASW